MIELKAIIQPFQLNQVIEALQRIEGLPGVTVSEVRGFGRSQGADAQDKIDDGGIFYARKAKIEIVIPEELLDTVLETILHEAHTGNPGDGKVFVSKVIDIVKIRTGERGDRAI